MRLDRTGALMPERGFSRRPSPPATPRIAAWASHDGLDVLSSRSDAYLPGSGEPPLVGPQWLVSVRRRVGGINARCRATDDDVARVVAAFDMPAFDEDNHHPGVARHLWCPVEEQYRSACECKVTEVTIVDASGYRWTTEADECRGCELERLAGHPCPIHRPAEVRA